MRVAIAGGHGQIALRLAKILSARGDEIVALIRNPDHRVDVRTAGAEPVVIDLEQASEDDVARAIPLTHTIDPTATDETARRTTAAAQPSTPHDSP